MDLNNFAINKLHDSASQEILENKLKMLLEGPLASRNSYGIEKCLLSFTEPLLYLESILLDKESIHPRDLPFILAEIGGKDYIDKVEEIRKIMISEINRQYRHFIAFL